MLVGSGIGGGIVFSKNVQTLLEEGNRRLSPFFITNIMPSSGSAKLAIEIGFQGPNYPIITACATSNYCIQAAANHIRQGDADLMIAGGSEATICPIMLGGFGAVRALSKRNDDPAGASRPWSKDRDGFVIGEGAGVLVYFFPNWPPLISLFGIIFLLFISLATFLHTKMLLKLSDN